MVTGRAETEADADVDAGDDEAGRRGAAASEGAETAHLDDVEDGCGCAEVWEHMSERRAED